MSKKKKRKGLTKKSAPKTPIQKATKTQTNFLDQFDSSFRFKNEWLAFLVIAILSTLLYAKTLPYEYVLDDKIVITDNSYTKSGFSGIWDILSTDSFQGYFGEQRNLVMGARYRPLSIVTFAVEHELFGLNRQVSHAINILLYMICCLLIYRMLKFIIPKSKNQIWYLSLGLLISVIYLVHPLHVEAVANIKGRDEIMAMIGSIWALIYAFKYQEKPKWLYLVLMSIGFFFGLFSKETTLTFLAVIPISLYFRVPRLDKRLLTVSATLLALCGLYLYIRYSIIGFLYDPQTNANDLLNNPFLEMNRSERIATIIYTTAQYMKLSFWPHPLTHDYYPYHIPIMKFSDPQVIVGLGALAACFVASFIGFFKRSWIAFGIIFFFLTLSIVSNAFVNVGTFMNERFAFMPSLGACIFLVLGLKWLTDKIKNGSYYFYGVMAIFCLGFMIKTWTRIPAWKDTFSLNSTAIKVSKNSARLNSFMSTAIYNKAKGINDRNEKYALLTEGIGYARKAVEIYPTYNNGHLMLAGISAEIYGIDNELEKFLIDLKRAASSRPDIPFITEYCEYLNGRSNVDHQKLLAFYYDLGYRELYKTRRNSRWALHYLKLGHSLDRSNRNINAALEEIYTFIGDRQNAEKHKNYGTQ